MVRGNLLVAETPEVSFERISDQEGEPGVLKGKKRDFQREGTV